MKLKSLLFPNQSMGPCLLTMAYWICVLALMFNAAVVWTEIDNWYLRAPQLLTLVGSWLLIRLGCEVIAVLFKMHADIQKLSNIMTGFKQNPRE
jgi:hypothetical protein